MSSDPHNIEATLSHDGIESLAVEFEYDDEKHSVLLNGFMDPEGLLKEDCVADEDGVSSIEEAIEQARHGYNVGIKIHQERARLLSMSIEF